MTTYTTDPKQVQSSPLDPKWVPPHCTHSRSWKNCQFTKIIICVVVCEGAKWLKLCRLALVQADHRSQAQLTIPAKLDDVKVGPHRVKAQMILICASNRQFSYRLCYLGCFDSSRHMEGHVFPRSEPYLQITHCKWLALSYSCGFQIVHLTELLSILASHFFYYTKKFFLNASWVKPGSHVFLANIKTTLGRRK